MSQRHNDPATTVSVQSLLNERHRLRESTLLQPGGAGQWSGNFQGARRGHGTDFDDLRHYSPGDEIRHIDWNASARTNVLHTRLYREEREHHLTLITDLRRTQFTGTHTLRAVKSCQLSARLVWQAVEGGSRCRVIVVRDAGIHISEHDRGHRAAITACALLAQCFAAHSSHALEGVIEVTAPLNAHGNRTNPGNTTLAHLAHWLLTQQPVHGTLIWMSAFDHSGEQFDHNLRALSQAANQAAVYVHDEMLETGLPAGRYGYRTGQPDARLPRTMTLDKKQVGRLRERLRHQCKERRQRFSDLNIPLFTTTTGFAQTVRALRHRGFLP